jgi:hypothetical protein
MNYKVYYADGSTYTGEPWDAPAFGVLVIVEKDADHGRRLVSAKDYYVWDEKAERWWSVDFIGMVDYLGQPGRKRVLFGRTVSNEEWYRIMRFANEDNDFPTRTGWGNKEEHV